MNKIFTSTHCSPCNGLKMLLRNRNDIDYISIDTDEGLNEAISYGVSATPTLLTTDLRLLTGLNEILEYINKKI